jgi:hypothetical protein
MTFSSPTVKEAAPSPNHISWNQAGLVSRMSDAVTRMFFRAPPMTDSRAASRAVEPAFWDAVKSDVRMSSLRFNAVDTMPAFCRSAKGREVDARKQASSLVLSIPARQSRAAATAMVTASSSQLHMDRSPWATMIRAGANQPILWYMAIRFNLKRGMYAP